LYSLLLLLPDHDHEEIVFQQQVAIFINKPVAASFLGSVNIGEVIEIESFIHHFIPMDSYFIGWIQFAQYFSVLPENIVHIPYIGSHIRILPVVVIVAALVGAEFFIEAPVNGFAAIEACTLFHMN
jgi:hypothetical protein